MAMDHLVYLAREKTHGMMNCGDADVSGPPPPDGPGGGLPSEDGPAAAADADDGFFRFFFS